MNKSKRTRFSEFFFAWAGEIPPTLASHGDFGRPIPPTLVSQADFGLPIPPTFVSQADFGR